MKSEIRKHPWGWVIGALLVGGLFLSGTIKGSFGKVKGATGL